MRINRLQWAPFRLAFVTRMRPVAPATTLPAPSHREGVVLRIVTDAGGIGLGQGLGEASPLPERDQGTAADVLALLAEHAPRFVGLSDDEALAALAELDPQPGLRALACAFDVATLDAAGRASGRPVAQLLPGVQSSRLVPAVEVNATVGEVDAATAARAAARAAAAGFRTVKLKVGGSEDAAGEVARVSTVREAIGPHVRLRLDANGAWTPLEAIGLIERLEPFQLEWVEQPVAADDLDGLQRVRAAVSTPIAADESVRSLDDARRLIDAAAADVLVLKPMSLGGLRPSWEVARLASGTSVRVVVTTTIDAGVATAAALHLAAAIPGEIPASGLATGSLLEDDLLETPLSIANGRMDVPQGGGLGIALNPASRLAWTGVP